MQTAYLGLGSNLGDRRALLSAALAELASAPGVRIARVSPVYETAAITLPGQSPQPDFLNLVIEIETTLDAPALLVTCLEAERRLGRVRRERWGARTVDIDLLLLGCQTSATPELTLPHPRLTERAFVLAPLADLTPDLLLAGYPVRAHLERLGRVGVVARPDLALGRPVLLEEVVLPCPPHEFFARLADRDHAFLLDSGLPSNGLGKYSFFGFSPFATLRSRAGATTLSSHPPSTQAVCHLISDKSPLDLLRDQLAKHRAHGNACHLTGDTLAEAPDLPFKGGAVGFFGYELCTQLEILPRSQADDLQDVPDCEFGFFDAFFAHEHATGRTWLVANPINATPAANLLARLRETLQPPVSDQSVCHLISDKPASPAPEQPTANFDFPGYVAAVERIKAYIASGDVYQVNLTQRFQTPLRVSAFELYQRLRRLSPAPFASFLSFGPVQVVSSSPERFLRLRGRLLETRPIKGTRPRDRQNAGRDAALATELSASEKDRAELLMIVDLERNDLGRVCDYGSVRVGQLWHLESHPTVHHLVASVTGTLRDGLDVIDCVRAGFPGGSITGAPKIRAMEIIDELEPHRRHIYTGAIGYIGFDGDSDLNIAIRTITCVGGNAYYHVGGGIVWDSTAAAEYQETLDKGRAMREALSGNF